MCSYLAYFKMENLEIDLFDDDSDEELVDLIDIIHPRAYVVRERSDNMNYWNDTEFILRFRIKKATALLLTQHVEDIIRFPTERNSALTPLQQVLITLRYYAAGSFQVTIGDFAGVHQTTISKIVKRVTAAICSLREIFVNLPDGEERLEVGQGFYRIAAFPRVLLVLDGTHVRICSPGGDLAEQFRNRKGYFSLNVQLACDYRLRIRNIVARWPGSVTDSVIFLNSYLKRRFDQGMENYLILGDSGYALSTYLMTPIENPRTPPEQLYNESHIRTRNVVERSIGVWKRRFPILAVGLRSSLDTVQDIIVATAIVHNIAIGQNEENIEVDEEIQQLIDEHVPADIVEINNGVHYRDEIINNYFAHL